MAAHILLFVKASTQAVMVYQILYISLHQAWTAKSDYKKMSPVWQGGKLFAGLGQSLNPQVVVVGVKVVLGSIWQLNEAHTDKWEHRHCFSLSCASTLDVMEQGQQSRQYLCLNPKTMIKKMLQQMQYNMKNRASKCQLSTRKHAKQYWKQYHHHASLLKSSMKQVAVWWLGNTKAMQSIKQWIKRKHTFK
jgi:hypothetical protein